MPLSFNFSIRATLHWLGAFWSHRENAQLSSSEKAIGAFLFILLLLLTIRLPSRFPSDDLDVSWASALSYFAERQFAFGTDVIFTLGPLGYLYGHASSIHTGHLLEQKMIGALFVAAVASGIMTWLLLRTARILGCLLFLHVIANYPFSQDAVLTFTIIFAVISLIVSKSSAYIPIATGAFLAALSLIKFSFLLTSILGIITASVYWIAIRRWLMLGLVLGAYLTIFTIGWIWNGQSITAIPTFLKNGFEISTGYSQTMFIAEPRKVSAIGILVLLILAMMVATHGLRHITEARVFLCLVLFTEGLFIAWKHGFTRADYGHVSIFFDFAALTVAGIGVITPLRPQAVSLGLSSLALLVILLGSFITRVPGFDKKSNANRMITDVENTVAALFDLPRSITTLNNDLSATKRKFALPKIKQIVGQDTIDVFGHEQGVALLNDLNYRPRPVFQSYSAYNEHLVRINEKYYESDHAPRFILFKLQTIDNRFPAADDSRSLQKILWNYTPITVEGGFILWQRKSRREHFPVLQALSSGTNRFSEPIDIFLDSRELWLRIEWDPTWLGKLREFFYKPAEVDLELLTTSDEKKHFRLVRPLASSGFLISPMLLDSKDVLNYATSREQTRVRAFQLHADRRYVQRDFRYFLSVMPRQLPNSTIPDDLL